MALRTTSTHFRILTLVVNSLSIFTAVKSVTDSDLPLPPTGTQVDSKFFTYTAGRSLVGAEAPTQFKSLEANKNTFPALAWQSVSLSVMQFPAGVVYPPHSHPRSSELLLLLSGGLQVGFMDGGNKLFNQTLAAGDMFVFPKGLVHYHYNFQPNDPAVAVSAFASSDPGLVSIPSNLFTAGIEDNILAQSFKTDIPTIQRLKSSVAGNSSQN